MKTTVEGVSFPATVSNSVYFWASADTETPDSVVLVKTLQDLQDSGWEQDSEGNWRNDQEPDFYVSKYMYPLLGEILPVKKSHWGSYEYDHIVDGEVKEVFSITDKMIKEYLDPKDYPEFFI